MLIEIKIGNKPDKDWLIVNRQLDYWFPELDYWFPEEKDEKTIAWNNPEAKSWKENPRYPMKPVMGEKRRLREQEKERRYKMDMDLADRFPAFAKVLQTGNKKQIETMRKLLK